MIITNFLNLLNQLKIYHWQTNSYAEHKAFGKAYDSLEDLVDTFIEIYMGKYGKRISTDGFNFSLSNYNSADVLEFLNQYDEYLSTVCEEELNDDDTELKNIRDDMKATINHTKYLLQLK